MIYSFLIIYQSYMARASGGGLFAHRVWSRLPEILFSVPFGYCAFYTSEIWYIGVLGFLLSYFSMELGHGTFYNMEGYRSDNPDRIQSLEKVVRPLYQRFGGDIHNSFYSWVCMGCKGFLIGLAAFPFGLSLTILWPFSYWIGHRIEGHPEVAEWLSGMKAGFAVFLTLVFYA